MELTGYTGELGLGLTDVDVGEGADAPVGAGGQDPDHRAADGAGDCAMDGDAQGVDGVHEGQSDVQRV